MRQPKDFDPSFRIGWDERGIVLGARVRDEAIITNPDVERLWSKDSVEIFVSRNVGSAESVQLTLAPPDDDTASKPTYHWREAGTQGSVQRGPILDVMGRRTGDGYVFEVLIPWENLPVEPGMNEEAAIQIFFNDSDTTEPYPADSFRVAWYPQGHAAWNPLAYHRVRC